MVTQNRVYVDKVDNYYYFINSEAEFICVYDNTDKSNSLTDKAVIVYKMNFDPMAHEQSDVIDYYAESFISVFWSIISRVSDYVDMNDRIDMNDRG